MALTAKDISEFCSGKINGDQEREISSIKGLAYAAKGDLSFLSKDEYKHLIEQSLASIILIQKGATYNVSSEQTFIEVSNVMAAVQLVSEKLAHTKTKNNTGISTLAKLDPTVSYGNNLSLGAYSVIDQYTHIGVETHIGSQVYIGSNVSIGDHCIIYPGVKIYAECVIGNHVIIHSNTVIGSDGFGFHFNGNEFKKIHHTGKVIIEDHVEIGSNTVIDRAAFDNTIIREGTKLDNLIQIAHNVEIGKHTVVAAQAGISGSVEVGNYCQIGGQVGVAGHLSIADGTLIQAKSGVPSSIKTANQKWYGYPILKYRDYLKSYAIFKKLPELIKELRFLKKEVDTLKNEETDHSIKS